jgi:hypothetical protein
MIRTDAGSRRRLPARYAATHLDHAYAVTGHTAQGATFNRAYVLLRDEGALLEWGYVAAPASERKPASTSQRLPAITTHAHAAPPSLGHQSASPARSRSPHPSRSLSSTSARRVSPLRRPSLPASNTSTTQGHEPEPDWPRPKASSTSLAGAGAADAAPSYGLK